MLALQEAAEAYLVGLFEDPWREGLRCLLCLWEWCPETSGGSGVRGQGAFLSRSVSRIMVQFLALISAPRLKLDVLLPCAIEQLVLGFSCHDKEILASSSPSKVQLFLPI